MPRHSELKGKELDEYINSQCIERIRQHIQDIQNLLDILPKHQATSGDTALANAANVGTPTEKLEELVTGVMAVDRDSIDINNPWVYKVELEDEENYESGYNY